MGVANEAQVQINFAGLKFSSFWGGHPICPLVTQKIVKLAWAFMGIGINVGSWVFWSSEQDIDLIFAALISTLKNTKNGTFNMTKQS